VCGVRVRDVGGVYAREPGARVTYGHDARVRRGVVVAINTSTLMWLYLYQHISWGLSSWIIRTCVCGSLVSRLSCLRRPGFNFSFII
jgi:hypothetical protein